MVRKKSERKTEAKEKMRGGEGTVGVCHYLDDSEMKHCRVLMELTLPPGASIGEHIHEGEEEYFLIREGSGTLLENGKSNPISAGDVTLTAGGCPHSLINSGNVPLVVTSVIVKY